MARNKGSDVEEYCENDNGVKFRSQQREKKKVFGADVGERVTTYETLVVRKSMTSSRKSYHHVKPMKLQTRMSVSPMYLVF